YSTVIGRDRRTSPQIIGGLTHRVPYDCTQPFSVNTKPSRHSPKYSTISFRSNSPCTSTSRPISSCRLMHCLILSKINCLYYVSEMDFFLQAARAALTSGVCGRDPIVVVGSAGK